VSNLAELKSAADDLPAIEQQQLMLYLADRLEARGASLPETPSLFRDWKADWMAEDEAAMRRFRPGA
jgi:hypothetical protein